MSFVDTILLLFSWMPNKLLVVAICILVLSAILLAFRIVRFVLDCIPFA